MHMTTNTFLYQTYRALLLAAILLVFPLLPQAHAELLDRIVAVVNDEIITLSELNESAEDYLGKSGNTAGTENDAAKSKILDQLITQHLIAQQARKSHVKVTDNEFQKAFEQHLSSLHLTHEQFLKKLHDAGIPEEHYMENLRNQLLGDKLILYEIRSRIIITDEMITDYYNTEFSSNTESSSGKAYYLLQMGFSWGGSADLQNDSELMEADKARAMKKAYDIYQKTQDGDDFAAMAGKYSDLPSATDGGDIGFLSPEDMADEMKTAIMKLKPGEISPVIELGNSYQFFKLLSIRDGDSTNEVPIASVQEKIRQKLFEEEFQKEYQKWVEKIQNESYIQKMF